MFLLRLLAVMAVIVVGIGVVAYALSGQRKYLDFSWRFCRYGLLVAMLLFALLVLERVASMAL